MFEFHRVSAENNENERGYTYPAVPVNAKKTAQAEPGRDILGIGFLEGELEAKLDLTGRSESVDAGAHSDAIDVVCGWVGSVDLANGAR